MQAIQPGRDIDSEGTRDGTTWKFLRTNGFEVVKFEAGSESQFQTRHFEAPKSGEFAALVLNYHLVVFDQKHVIQDLYEPNEPYWREHDQSDSRLVRWVAHRN